MKQLIFVYGWEDDSTRITKTVYIIRCVIKEAIKQFVTDFFFTRKYHYKFFIKGCKLSNI